MKYKKGDAEAEAYEEVSAMISGPSKPMVVLTAKDLPEIKDWQVGKKYRILLTVRQKELHEYQKNNLCAHFEVEKAEPYGA